MKLNLPDYLELMKIINSYDTRCLTVDEVAKIRREFKLR